MIGRFASEQMKKNGGGAIVNVDSQSAFFAQPTFITYSVTKAAILHMTRLGALDLGPANIRVNTVCSGTILTKSKLNYIEKVAITLEQFKEIEGGKTILKRVGQPPEVARVIAFLASAEASYITVAYLLVDGGRRELS